MANVAGSGFKQHVQFLAAREAVDRSAVEGHAAVECLPQLRDGDRDVLRHPHDVDEAQPDEADVPLLGDAQDIALGHLLGFSVNGG